MIHKCQLLRRKLVNISKLNVVSGEIKLIKKEWIVEMCNNPLFDERGVCASCAAGWEVEENYPVKSNGKRRDKLSLVEIKNYAAAYFASRFPSVEECEVNENGCLYVYLKKGDHQGVSDGFFRGLESNFSLRISRYDTVIDSPRITFF